MSWWARITQIMDSLMLAPEIQEEVLVSRLALTLRELQTVVKYVAWQQQRETWRATWGVRDDLMFRERLSERPLPSSGAARN